MPESRFEIYTGHGGDWRFRLIAENNEIISVGQAYESKQGCLKGIRSIKENAGDAPVYHREEGEEIKNLEEIELIKDDEKVLARNVTGDEKIVFVEAETEPEGKEPATERTSEGLGDKIVNGLAIIAIIVAIITLIWIIISI